jgi:hypothetical protein
MATVIAIDASDPSADGGVVAWHRPGRTGVLARAGGTEDAPGAHPAVGDGLLAWIGDGVIEVRSLSDPRFARTVPAPGADAVAVSARWVAWRARRADGDDLVATPLAGGAPVVADRASAPAQLGRPSLSGDELAWHHAGRRGSCAGRTEDRGAGPPPCGRAASSRRSAHRSRRRPRCRRCEASRRRGWWRSSCGDVRRTAPARVRRTRARRARSPTTRS